ncbi:NAD-dependent epimerase/dehydratase family protein [Microbacterium lacusdiani]
MARALVVGGNGFIGAHLVDQLARDGWDVEAFDRFSSGPRYTARNVRQVVGTFSSGDEIRHAITGQDLVVHSLSATTPAKTLGGPQADVEANLLPTLHMLGQCVATGVGRVIFVSSGGTVYGSVDRAAHEEDALLPISPYGIGKAAIERYLAYYGVEHGLSSVVLRVANPYGLRTDRSLPGFGLVSALLRAAEAGSSVMQLGDGTMVRDYIHIDDLTRMVAAIVADREFTGAVNIGSGGGATVAAIIDTVRKVTGAELPVESRPVPPSFVEHIVLDLGRYVERFGTPELATLEAGIAQTWKDWRQ